MREVSLIFYCSSFIWLNSNFSIIKEYFISFLLSIMKYISLFKKTVFIGIFVFWVFSLSSVSAFQAVSWENITVSQKVLWDIYIAGSKVVIDAPVQWDLTVFGGEVTINKPVAGDINVIWWKVIVNADSWDDIRIAGWEITLKRAVWGDVLIAWWKVLLDDPTLITWGLYIYAGEIDNQSTISGDMYLNAQDINFDGTVFWNAHITSEKSLQVSNESKIRWNLFYTAPSKNTSLETGTNGQKEYVQAAEEESSLRENYILTTFYSFLFLVGFGSFFYFYFERFFFDVQKELVLRPLRSWLLWLWLYVGFPFLTFLLFLTIIWIPFWILSICLFIFLFLFAKLFSVVVASSIITQKLWGYKKFSFVNKLGILFVVALVFAIIPYVGFLFSFFAYGAITTKKYEILEKLR